MNNMRKLLCLLLAFVMLVSMAACTPNADTTTTDPNGTTTAQLDGEKVPPIEYRVTVKSAAGVPLEGVFVQFNDQNGEMQDYAQTNENGIAASNLPRQDGYQVQLSGVPEGYSYDPVYTMVGSSLEITLASGPIPNKTIDLQTKLDVGDIVYDFTITDTTGKTYKVSDILKEKKVLILNFFFTTCSPCISEVPYMNEAYELYKDEVEILAMDPLDDNADVTAFKRDYGLNFPMASVPDTWASMAVDFSNGGTAYPTTYVIDRYGMICIREQGALSGLTPWLGAMEYFASDEYVQTLCPNGFADVVTYTPPTVDNDTPEQLGATLGTADGNIVYSNDESAQNQYTWPFKVSSENKLGRPCVYAANMGYNYSYSMLIADVTLKAGQAIAFDYFVSIESNADILHVIVDEEPIYSISGYNEVPQWQTAYPWVAERDGVYNVAIAYIKDDSQDAQINGVPVPWTDEVYLSNFRIVDNVDEIDTETYLPTDAYWENEDGSYSYPEVFFNEADGYYHVGSMDGPLLLANMMTETNLWETGLYEMALNGDFKIGGEDPYARLIEIYANYSSKSKKTYFCTVNQELADILKACVDLKGFSGDESEWLQLCMYYRAYGTNGAQLEDPIAGIAFFSALTAVEGENSMPYHEGIPLIPRGKFAKFVPTRTGVYRITTHLPEGQECDGFIFPDFGDTHVLDVAESDGVYVYEGDERQYYDGGNVSMVYYMVAGETYYIDVCFYDLYEVGDIPYTIEYVGESYGLFRRAAPTWWVGTETEDGGMDGEHLQRQGILVMIGEDGLLYHNRGTVENPVKGSKIYLDMIGTQANLGDIAIYSEYGGVLNMHGFDFTMNATDQELKNMQDRGLTTYEQLDNYLRETLGDSYEELAPAYKLEEFMEGKYHGLGTDRSEANQKYLRNLITSLGLDPAKYEAEDMVEIDGVEYHAIVIEDGTEFVRSYVSKIIPNDGSDNADRGCVEVDAELALYLQLLMDTHGFAGVQDSWLKLCYYYDYMGSV